MGDSLLKISKTWFRDSGWPNSSTQWANFLVGFGGPRPLRAQPAHVVATPIFPPNVVKSKMKNKHYNLDFYHYSIDNSLLNSKKKLSPIGPEMAVLWPKNLCPNMGMRAIFGQIWIFLNETNTIRFVPINFMFCAICNSMYA